MNTKDNNNSKLRNSLVIGSDVRLDKGFRNSSIVKVISQTHKKLYTTVTSNGVEWEVMTYRLSHCL